MRESVLESASGKRAGKQGGKNGGKNSGKPRGGATGEKPRRLRRLLSMRPGAALAFFSLAAIGLAVVVNAVFLQSDRHPAPFFARKVPAQPPAMTRELAARPQPAPRPLDIERDARGIEPPQRQRLRQQLPVIDDPEKELVRPARLTQETDPPGPPRKPREPGPARDLIGSLISGGMTSVPRPPARIPGRSPDASADSANRKAVEAAQKALAKLGHKIDVDGISGPATRTAIEAFERANRLPVTGRPEGRTLQALLARSRVQTAR